MSRIASVCPAFPPHRYAQAEVTEAFAAACGLTGDRRQLLEQLHSSAQVETRHLALPIEQYPDLTDFGAANDIFLDQGVELGSAAVRGALEQAGLPHSSVDALYSTTTTGIAVPSLEARVAGRLGLPPEVKRVPLLGLGCVGGAAGLARMHDYLVGWPGDVAVLLTVELCSLTLQIQDTSTANLVASGLFGDGAGAVVMVGDDVTESVPSCRGPRVVGTRAHLYPDTERVMAWDVGSWGFKIVLDAEVPDLVCAHLADDVRQFLAQYDLDISDIGTWVAHPGGPKVLEAMAEALGLPEDAFGRTWKSLAELGNLSSLSVLTVLADVLEHDSPEPGSYGLLLALGPGFCSELVLLQW